MPACDWNEFCECYKSAPPTLNTLRRAFAEIMQFAWSDSSRMDGLEDALGCLTWSSNKEESNLEIGSATAKDPGTTQHVPGIFVSFPQGIQFSLDGVGGNLMHEFSDLSGGGYSKIGETVGQINCKHHDPDVACMMADYCLLVLTAIQERLWSIWGRWLLDYQPVSISEPEMKNPIEGSTQSSWYECNVTFKLVFNYQVIVQQESKRLKAFSIDAEAVNQSKPIRCINCN